MRPLAIIPLLCSIAAFILSLLCVFAGSKPGLMEDYAIVTLNTSRIGEKVLNSSSSSSSSNSSNPLLGLFHNVTSGLENDLGSAIDGEIGSLARHIGVHDWYSAHMLDYCEGFYTPAAVPNASVPASAIRENITYCSNRSALFAFDPTGALQADLNKTHGGINLSEIHWPNAIEDGIQTLRATAHAAFVLYCIAIGLLGLALLTALFTFFLPRGGRLAACSNMLLDMFAFLAIAIASTLVTAVMVKAVRVLNKYGSDVSIQAARGGKFLALTWAATALALLSVLAWFVECCVGADSWRARRRHGSKEYDASVSKS